MQIVISVIFSVLLVIFLINSRFQLYWIKFHFKFCTIHFKSGLLKQRMKSISHLMNSFSPLTTGMLGLV